MPKRREIVALTKCKRKACDKNSYLGAICAWMLSSVAPIALTYACGKPSDTIHIESEPGGYEKEIKESELLVILCVKKENRVERNNY